MGCTECDKETDELRKLAFYRIGNQEIGYANIALVGCRAHIKLALDKLNQK
jgi:hypothetical protein